MAHRVAEGRFTEWRGVLRSGEAWLVQWRKGVDHGGAEWIRASSRGATSGGAWHDMRVNKNIPRTDTYTYGASVHVGNVLLPL